MENSNYNKNEIQMDDQYYHRKKHTLFILPRFQFKIVSFTIFTSVGFIGVVFLSYKLIFKDQIMKLFEVSNLTETSKVDFLNELNINLTYLFLVFGVLSLLMIGLSIYFSHRVAGPLYQINKILFQFINGNRAARLHFRQGDELMFLEDKLNLVLNQAASAKPIDSNRDQK